ncbi:MAG TPA: hypothetical protein VMW69_11105, partial [Spirochaetia bacterium]|nr:hypothetical protein [Spirochaetia bacterium]
MSFAENSKSPRLRVLGMLLVGIAALALASCDLASLFSTPVSITGRIDKFNADLKAYDWADLVKQFSDSNVMKQSGQMNDPTTFFSNYPFAQSNNPNTPGQVVLSSSSISYNTTKTSATMTATYQAELSSAYTLTITMDLSSTDNSWYILEID